MEEFSYIGEWWMPGASERVYGTLSYTHVPGLVLSGIATIADLKRHRQAPLMWGITGSGEKVTLIGRSSYGWSNGGVTNFRLRAEIAVLGAHLDDPETGFSRAKLGFTRLREWTATPYFNERESNDTPSRLGFEFSFPEPLVATVRGGELAIEHDLLRQGEDNSVLRLTPRAYLNIVSDSRITITDWVRKFVRPFQQFLALATGKPVGVTEFGVYLDSAKEAHEKPIRIIMLSAIQGEKEAEIDDDYDWDSLFSLEPIRQHWAQVIRDWFILADDLGPTMDMFFSLAYSDSMYLEHQFLTLMQVAESYSRVRRRLDPPINKKEFEAKKAEVLGYIPPELRDWLEPRVVPYSGSPSLRLRIDDLIKQTAPILRPLIPDALAFARQVTEMRNLLEHKSYERGSERHELMHILQMVYRLKVILSSSFLLEIGIPPDQAAQIFQNNSRYRDELRHLDASQRGLGKEVLTGDL